MLTIELSGALRSLICERGMDDQQFLASAARAVAEKTGSADIRVCWGAVDDHVMAVNGRCVYRHSAQAKAIRQAIAALVDI